MKRMLTILLLAATLWAIPGIALALTAPNSMSIQSVRAFQNVAETGDMAIVFHYLIDYGVSSYPETPASTSILFRLYSDNGTLLATSSPYVFSDFTSNGYGNGAGSFYFSGATNPGWGAAYDIDILGIPAYYSPPQTSSYTMTSGDYDAAATQAEARTNLYDYIIDVADELRIAYPTVTLKSVTDSGTVLSSDGEAYFRGAVPGIQAMCPSLFFIQVYIPGEMPVSAYTNELGDNYTATLEGSDLARGADRLGDAIGGVSGPFVFGGFAFLGSMAACIFTLRKGWGIEPGMGVAAGIVILGALIVGNFFFTLTMIGGLVGAMAIMWVFALKRA